MSSPRREKKVKEGVQCCLHFVIRALYLSVEDHAHVQHRHPSAFNSGDNWLVYFCTRHVMCRASQAKFEAARKVEICLSEVTLTYYLQVSVGVLGDKIV